MHPSTKRSATIGGFVAGGSGGVGSVTWGGLREPGNVAAARIVTMEAEPRIIELREAEAQAVNHAYGTTGLITALEMPLAPAWQWIDMIVAFPTFIDAVRFGYAVAAGGWHREEAALADCLAHARLVPAGARALPRRTGHPDRDDRRTVCPGFQVCAVATSSDRNDHLRAANRRWAGRGPTLRIHLEPHDPADAEAGPQRHLPADLAPGRRAGGQRRCGRNYVLQTN